MLIGSFLVQKIIPVRETSKKFIDGSIR